MYSASVTVSLAKDATFLHPRELYFGTATSTNISSGVGSTTISLPSSMHSGTAAKTYIMANQLDNQNLRARFAFSYSVASNCQTATIYFRDVTGSVANGASISVSYIVLQDRT